MLMVCLPYNCRILKYLNKCDWNFHISGISSRRMKFYNTILIVINLSNKHKDPDIA